MSLLQYSEYGLIYYEPDHNGNYIVSHRNRSVVVLPRAFHRIAKPDIANKSGKMSLLIDKIRELGFIV